MEIQALHIALIVGLIVSGVATVAIWRRIVQSTDPSLMKLAVAAIVAIPFFGPLLWLFLDMPSRRPGVAGPFRGPLAPLPTEPKWAAVSAKVLIVLAAIVVTALLIYVLLSTIRTNGN